MQRAQATIFRCALALGSAALLACAASAPAPTAERAWGGPAEAPAWGGRTRSDSGRLLGRIYPESGDRIEIGRFQDWVLELRETSGADVTGAAIAIAGGMPGHGHGLPTQPRVTEELGGGRYRIEGVKLNMIGAWVIEVFVETPALRDRLRFDLAIDY
jgi:YtkA-like